MKIPDITKCPKCREDVFEDEIDSGVWVIGCCGKDFQEYTELKIVMKWNAYAKGED